MRENERNVHRADFRTMEITNGVIKWVYSLAQKKNRTKEGCFVVEGTKCVLDTIGSFRVKYLFATDDWIGEYGGSLKVAPVAASRVQLERMSMLKTATDVIAVCETPGRHVEDEDFAVGLTLVLDGVQDPGNLGTIIRIADWFGIRRIVCSKATVDVYNPKVVQAAMGALSRVAVFYGFLPELFKQYADMPVYGTFLEGESLYEAELQSDGFIVMGNEGNGISPEVERYATRRLLIPSFPPNEPTSESLNVGMATAIVVNEFRRRMLTSNR